VSLRLPNVGRTFDYASPLERAHPLNRGRKSWLLSLPQRAGGRRFLDLIGTGHATFVNGTTGAGARGRPGGYGALLFDGTDDRCTLPDFTADSFSLSAWIMQVAAGDDFATFLAWDNFPTSPRDFVLFKQTGGKVHVYAGVNGTSGDVLDTSTSVLGVWRHYLVTRSGTTATVYIDGVSRGTITVGSGSRTFVEGRLGNHAYSGGENEFGNCLIDDVSRWDRALADDEVRALHDESRRGYPSTLRRLSARAWSFASGGAFSATGTGSLTAETATLAGTGALGVNGTGALSAQAATSAATATVTNAYTSTGAVTAEVATLAGTGTLTGTGTKIYLTTGAAGYTPATLRGAWDDTSGVVSKALAFTKVGGGDITSVSKAETSLNTEFDVLLYRGVSGPLAARTISGTFDVMLGTTQTTTSDDMSYHVHVYVTQGDSDTPRGTILGNHRDTDANEWTSDSSPGPTQSGRGLEGPPSLTSLAISNADRLVIELGYVARNGSAIARTGKLYYGTSVSGTPASDLANAGDGTTLAGFLLFSGTITEQFQGTATGALTAEVATLAGTGVMIAPITGTGALVAEAATLAGLGTVPAAAASVPPGGGGGNSIGRAFHGITNPELERILDREARAAWKTTGRGDLRGKQASLAGSGVVTNTYTGTGDPRAAEALAGQPEGPGQVGFNGDGALQVEAAVLSSAARKAGIHVSEQEKFTRRVFEDALLLWGKLP
jgi:hypothetical protein